MSNLAMSNLDRRAHWQNVYQTKGEREVSWYQENPAISLELIRATDVADDASIVDIGGGTSRLVDALLIAGFSALTVLDISERALVTAKARLGAAGEKVMWIAADVMAWEPPQSYDVWHDRAAFHFLIEAEDRAAYAERVLRAVRPGGHVIIGTFALDGPERCSGLPVMRHDPSSIGKALGPAFRLVEDRRHAHHTLMGTIQHFQFSRFQRAT